MTAITISDQEYRDFCRFLESQCGIVLGDSKQYLVRSRLSPLVTKYKLASLSDLLRDVVTGRNRELRVAAVDAMTTNETLWFRDTYPFAVLADRLLPELAKNKRPLKIWSAASSSGQEPYSMAMTILEVQQRRRGYCLAWRLRQPIFLPACSTCVVPVCMTTSRLAVGYLQNVAVFSLKMPAMAA